MCSKRIISNQKKCEAHSGQTKLIVPVVYSDLGYNDLKFSVLFSKIATVISFEVAISNVLSLYVLNFTFFYQMSFGNSDRAAYSDLNPRDGGQSLYPTSTVF